MQKCVTTIKNTHMYLNAATENDVQTCKMKLQLQRSINAQSTLEHTLTYTCICICVPAMWGSVKMHLGREPHA